MFRVLTAQHENVASQKPKRPTTTRVIRRINQREILVCVPASLRFKAAQGVQLDMRCTQTETPSLIKHNRPQSNWPRKGADGASKDELENNGIVPFVRFVPCLRPILTRAGRW
jgi:hypothetical protein